ncbi:MAG TPA: hypothetical protein VD835_03160 [Pyrinomonadaceae bacterium]|nr:hypothetical protein [Pyrinomonadaceae bacterium]
MEILTLQSLKLGVRLEHSYSNPGRAILSSSLDICFIHASKCVNLIGVAIPALLEFRAIACRRNIQSNKKGHKETGQQARCALRKTAKEKRWLNKNEKKYTGLLLGVMRAN